MKQPFRSPTGNFSCESPDILKDLVVTVRFFGHFHALFSVFVGERSGGGCDGMGLVRAGCYIRAVGTMNEGRRSGVSGWQTRSVIRLMKVEGFRCGDGVCFCERSSFPSPCSFSASIVRRLGLTVPRYQD